METYDIATRSHSGDARGRLAPRHTLLNETGIFHGVMGIAKNEEGSGDSGKEERCEELAAVSIHLGLLSHAFQTRTRQALLYHNLI